MATVSKGNSIEIDVVRGALDEDYEVLEELGRGGMAIVYRAREKALDREVAIKVLPATLALDAEFVERFQHEARTAGKLEHPNIVPIYRVGRAGPGGQVIYFVMKLLRGQSLGAVLRERGKLEAPELRRILMESISALGYAAKRSVVHRDIKPDNILLDAEGRCVITDFGIAKTPGGQATAAGTSLGTPRYMSPEHAQGTPLDGRSDMYSLGVVAYQCLTGATPFNADDPFAVLYKHINEPLPTPELKSEDEKKLYAVIEKMLAKKPVDRYQSADEVIQALGGEVATMTLVTSTIPGSPGLMMPTEIIETALTTRALRFVMAGRRKWVFAVGGILLIGGALFAIPGDSTTTASADTARQGSSVGASTSVIPSAPVIPSAARDLQSVGASASVIPSAARDSVTPPPTPAAPRPSARAAAILAMNRVNSKCPRQADTTLRSRPIAYALLMDSVGPQKPRSTLNVRFDVCGLAKGAKFNAQLIFQNLGRNILGKRADPVVYDFSDVAPHGRYRRTRPIDLTPFRPENYSLRLLIVDAAGRRLEKATQFRLLER